MQKQTLFLIITFVFALSHLVMWHLNPNPLKRQTKAPGSVFALSRLKENRLGPRKESFAKLVVQGLLSLSPSLFLSPQGQRHPKGLYLGVRPTKALCRISSSFEFVFE